MRILFRSKRCLSHELFHTTRSSALFAAALLITPSLTFAMQPCPSPWEYLVWNIYDENSDNTNPEYRFPDTDTRQQNPNEQQPPEAVNCPAIGSDSVLGLLISSSSIPTTSTQNLIEQSRLNEREKSRQRFVRESLPQLQADIVRGEGEAIETYSHMSGLPIDYSIQAGQLCMADQHCDLAVYLILLPPY